MKKIYLILFCIMTISIPLFAQNSPRFNIMTFNIRYDNPDDGEQNWHKRKENVIRMVNFYDLDIIGMQEVLVSQLNYLKDNLPEFNSVGVGRKDGKEKGEFTPVFYRKNRFRELDHGTFWLSETPDKVSKGWDAALERIATWIKLQDKTTGKEFLFINTHFDHRGKQARVESARLLKTKIAKLANGKQVMLTGDFNLVPESEGIQTLIKPDGENTLVNSSSVAEITYGPNWTSTGFDNRPYDQRRVIDYIFLKDIKTVKRYAVIAEKLNALQLSDHCPVFVQVEL